LSQNLHYPLEKCRLCESSDLSNVIKLSPTPAGNNFLTENEKNQGSEPIFPLDVNFCKTCFHLQLGHVVDPDHLFKDYHFVSGTSKVNIKHFDDFAEKIISKFKLKRGSFILDIGSNDGTCLKSFQERGMIVLGVDPANNVAKIANDNGVETISDYFSDDLAMEIKEKYGVPDLITSHNVLAHIEQFSEVMKAIRSLMNRETIFIFEVGYFLDVFQNLWFDTIYHEHLDYHTVAPLKTFFKTISMDLFHVEQVDIQGGSIRNFVQLESGSNQTECSVRKLIKTEENTGLHSLSKILGYQTRIDRSKSELLVMLKGIKESGKSIAGYGAPTKSTTLMNHFGIDKDLIDYIVDDNNLKQGKFSPLLHIPIVSQDKLSYDPKPDYLIILAWNFADSIIEKVREKNIFKGNYIIPLPNPKIVKDKI